MEVKGSATTVYSRKNISWIKTSDGVFRSAQDCVYLPVMSSLNHPTSIIYNEYEDVNKSQIFPIKTYFCPFPSSASQRGYSLDCGGLASKCLAGIIKGKPIDMVAIRHEMRDVLITSETEMRPFF